MTHLRRLYLLFLLLAVAGCPAPDSETSSSASGDSPNVAAQADELIRADQFTQAEELLRSAIASAPKPMTRDEQIATASLHRRLAQSLAGQQRYDEAEPEAQSAYDELQPLFEPVEDHPAGHEELARAAWTLGEIKSIRRNFEEAEALMRDAATWFEAHKATSLDTAILLGQVGDCMAQQGRYADAEDAVVQSYTRLRKELGDAAPETLDAFQRVIFLYQAWDRPDKIQEYLATNSVTGG